MQELSTIFTPPPWCSNRYAVYIDHGGPLAGSSTNPPTSGWIDPLFTQCVPSQYQTAYPTFSPGVCPEHMSIVTSTFNVEGSKTIWTGGCCQSGFSNIAVAPEWVCTSTVTTPMAFLLIPNISTADIYTTLSTNLWIEHDQLTVQWEQSDLRAFPREVATHYASMMGVQAPTSTDGPGPTISPTLYVPQTQFESACYIESSAIFDIVRFGVSAQKMDQAPAPGMAWIHLDAYRLDA
ncbi:Uu.00g131970.m01.CDS01 [Anthostomella pinea]|uniref:Uu.00g131970.m01.CDS01 n=1 Tax=Anthostomella pinea TaxID=933095 RepID=A0AAI8YFW9_9PEZI|nr:Uu.00g131970.m01.CDS01 [Anthostomella pinea]